MIESQDHSLCVCVLVCVGGGVCVCVCVCMCSILKSSRHSEDAKLVVPR